VRTRPIPALLALLAIAFPAGPACAWMNPYVRAAYGANQLKMDAVNDNLHDTENTIQEMGYPAKFQNVAPAYGPHASAGLWLVPGLRVGATYDYQRSTRTNRVHVPGSFFYQDDLDLRMRELGIEAAFRMPHLYGLLIGGGIAHSDAKAIEGTGTDSYSGPTGLDMTATGTGKTYNVFVGLEQTNPTHFVGFLRLGYRHREMGHMNSSGTFWDGVNTTPVSAQTANLDYSGIYAMVGMGYDLTYGR